jgi:acyl-CoA synthetase (AMP-forming)/AMP-acid ligase II
MQRGTLPQGRRDPGGSAREGVGVEESLFRFEQVVKSRRLGGRHFDWVEWDLLRRNAMLYGAREAYRDFFPAGPGAPPRRRTWAEAFDDVNRLVLHALDRGVGPGAAVVSQLPNCLESAYWDWATSKLRARHAALNLDLGRREVVGVLEKVRPRVAVIVPEWHGRPLWEWYREAQQTVPEMRILTVAASSADTPAGTEALSDWLTPSVWERYGPDDLTWLRTDPLAVHELLPTAGTTGVPKLSQRTTVDWFHVHSVCIAERTGQSVYDTRILIGPLAGGSGRLWGVHVPLYTGGRTILIPEFDEATVLRLTTVERATVWTWNPALITRLVTAPAFADHDLTTLRQVSYSGAPLPEDVIARLVERGVMPFNVYGTSEVGGCMSPVPPGISRRHLLEAAGVPFEGFDVPVVDADGTRVGPGVVGEILIWNIHHGYLASPDENVETYHDSAYGGRWEGYQHTGDLGVYDDEGYLRVVGRKKDMILRGGQNIFPKEVEDLLSRHPDVRDVAVVGMPDPVLGERVCAFVVPAAGAVLGREELVRHLAALDVAKFKWPERVEVVDALPMGPGGKVLKGALRDRIRAALEQEAAASPAPGSGAAASAP